jgi:hypothetical protein
MCENDKSSGDNAIGVGLVFNVAAQVKEHAGEKANVKSLPAVFSRQSASR